MSIQEIEIQKTEQTLLTFLSAALFGAPYDMTQTNRMLQDVDVSLLFREALEQGVLPLVYSAITPEVLSAFLREKVQRMVSSALANHMRIEWEHTQVHALMQAQGIPYVILKGCASAEYYPDPSLRAMGDVDFLVNERDAPRAGAALKQAGCTPPHDRHYCHFAYHKGNVGLEVHFAPPGIPAGPVGDVVRGYFKDCIPSARAVQTDAGTMMLPSVFHHGLILLLHTCHHMTGEGIGLRHLCDWAVFAGHLSDQEFRALYQDKLEKIGLWRYAQLLTQLSIRYLGCPEKAWAMEDVDEPLLRAMLLDIFQSGNFGRKDQERSNQAYLISDRGKDGVKDGLMLKQFFVSVNGAVQVHFPACKKHPVLLPVGWVYVCTRHAWRIVRGKRKTVHIGSMMAGAQERRALYRQFRLYEPVVPGKPSSRPVP